jgi:hypothetical protein
VNQHLLGGTSTGVAFLLFGTIAAALALGTFPPIRARERAVESSLFARR